MFLRYQSATPNRRGTFPGVFALVNGLARDGKLTAANPGRIVYEDDHQVVVVPH